MIIYGGRNDSIFPVIGNVALNDVCIFNVNFKTWTSLVVYGMQPCSRWSLVMMPNRKHSPDGILVFGGVNLNNYCTSRIYNLSIVNFGRSMNPDETKMSLEDISPVEKSPSPQFPKTLTIDRRLNSLKISPIKGRQSSAMDIRENNKSVLS
jgi:hypothetical protein